jgi:hypothetical protein
MQLASGITWTQASAADSPSSEPGPAPAAGAARPRGLRPAERLCVLGAVVVAGSLVLPWYDVAFTHISRTALDKFGFVHVALLLTVGSAVVLIVRATRGYVLPRPFSEGVILAVAGGWAAMLVAYLLVDRPEQLDGSTDVGLGLGGFVALGGAVVLIVGGLRVRRDAQIRRLRSSV